MGWMLPFCITTGNTFVLKAASMVPQTAIRMLELLIEAGLPKGVVSLVTCSRVEADSLLVPPRRPRRRLRRLNPGRPAYYLPDRRRGRGTRPGSDRGEEPRPRPGELRPRAVGEGHRRRPRARSALAPRSAPSPPRTPMVDPLRHRLLVLALEQRVKPSWPTTL